MAQPAPTAPARIRLGELLLREGRIAQEQLQRALDDQRQYGGRVGRHLVDMGAIGEDTLLDALSRQLRIPRVDLDQPGLVNPDVARYARADLCEQWGFCPVAFDKNRNMLAIAVSDPEPGLLADIEGLIGQRVEPILAPQSSIERAVQRLYHEGGQIRQMQGLQVARGVAKDAKAGNNMGLDAIGPGPAATLPPPAPPAAPPPPAPVNPFDAQIAQQVAMQQQLQQQLQQQIHLQQLQHMQMQAAQARGQSPGFPAQGPMTLAPGLPMPPAGFAPQYPPQQGFPYYPETTSPPGAPPPQPAAPLAPPPERPAPTAPPPTRRETSRAAPMLPEPEAPSLEKLAEQLDRLEKTLSAQARALRSLVEVLVEKGMLSKAEMARKQQELGGGR